MGFLNRMTLETEMKHEMKTDTELITMVFEVAFNIMNGKIRQVQKGNQS